MMSRVCQLTLVWTKKKVLHCPCSAPGASRKLINLSLSSDSNRPCICGVGQDTSFLMGQVPGYSCHATVLSLMILCELPVSYHLPAPTSSLSSANKIGARCLGC